ncbi:MAG TPA: PqqD family protein [Nitriliruptorales bacterium]
MDARLKLDRTAIEWRHVEGEVVALDLRDSMYLGINPTGALLWPHLAEGATRDELVEVLLDQHEELDQTRARNDVDAFLGSLRERNLLVEATEEPPPS